MTLLIGHTLERWLPTAFANLEDVAKIFHCGSRVVLPAVFVLSGRMGHYFRYEDMWYHSKWSYEAGNCTKWECMRETLLYFSLDTITCIIFRKLLRGGGNPSVLNLALSH